MDLSVRLWHAPTLLEGNDAVDGAVRAIELALEEAGIRFAPTASVGLDHGTG